MSTTAVKEATVKACTPNHTRDRQNYDEAVKVAIGTSGHSFRKVALIETGLGAVLIVSAVAFVAFAMMKGQGFSLNFAGAGVSASVGAALIYSGVKGMNLTINDFLSDKAKNELTPIAILAIKAAELLENLANLGTANHSQDEAVVKNATSEKATDAVKDSTSGSSSEAVAPAESATSEEATDAAKASASSSDSTEETSLEKSPAKTLAELEKEVDQFVKDCSKNGVEFKIDEKPEQRDQLKVYYQHILVDGKKALAKEYDVRLSNIAEKSQYCENGTKVAIVGAALLATSVALFAFAQLGFITWYPPLAVMIGASGAAVIARSVATRLYGSVPKNELFKENLGFDTVFKELNDRVRPYDIPSSIQNVIKHNPSLLARPDIQKEFREKAPAIIAKRAADEAEAAAKRAAKEAEKLAASTPAKSTT